MTARHRIRRRDRAAGVQYLIASQVAILAAELAAAAEHAAPIPPGGPLAPVELSEHLNQIGGAS
jgi:hypothetical protein